MNSLSQAEVQATRLNQQKSKKISALEQPREKEIIKENTLQLLRIKSSPKWYNSQGEKPKKNHKKQEKLRSIKDTSVHD